MIKNDIIRMFEQPAIIAEALVGVAALPFQRGNRFLFEQKRHKFSLIRRLYLGFIVFFMLFLVAGCAKEKPLYCVDDFVKIPAGEFMMGSPDGEAEREKNETEHRVKLSEFFMARHEVSVAEFSRFIAEKGDSTDATKDGWSFVYKDGKWTQQEGVNWRCDPAGKIRPLIEYHHPVVHVSWNDVNAYCKWLSSKTGKTFQLPTEAEWEYACRAGTITPFATGSNLTTDQANYDGNYPYKGNTRGEFRFTTVPVNYFAPNDWGLYNMHGNVWEWCRDWYGEKYYEACMVQGVVENPENTDESSSYRVLRGGSWLSNAWFCRSAARDYYPPDYRRSYVGFRLVFVP